MLGSTCLNQGFVYKSLDTNASADRGAHALRSAPVVGCGEWLVSWLV